MIPIIYRFILYPGRQLYWAIFRPNTKGVKVFIQYNNEILLIKNTYGKRHLWTIPGGGVKKNELLSLAAKREVKEEVGIELRDLKKIGIYQDKKDTKYIFKSTVQNKNFNIDKNEIAFAQWFKLKKLPVEQTTTLQNIFKYLIVY